MKIHFRRLGRGETDAELIALAVLVTAGMLTAAWLLIGLPTPKCLFHSLTGVPCLTCGGTRCMRALLSGHPGVAMSWNPLVFTAVACAGLYAVYAAAAVLLRLPRIRISFPSRRVAALARIVIVLLAGANWVYLVARFARSGG